MLMVVALTYGREGGRMGLDVMIKWYRLHFSSPDLRIFIVPGGSEGTKRYRG